MCLAGEAGTELCASNSRLAGLRGALPMHCLFCLCHNRVTVSAAWREGEGGGEGAADFIGGEN